MNALREVLNPWLGDPRWNQTEGRVTFVYRFPSEDAPPITLRLKAEINSREHFAVFGVRHEAFSVSSRWFEGACNIATYSLDELLGTKLRALYQRKKGRDLFDLCIALKSRNADPDNIVKAFLEYMNHGGHKVTRAEFEQNLHGKLGDRQFAADIGPLLASGVSWDQHIAVKLVGKELIARLPGEAWKGGNKNN